MSQPILELRNIRKSFPGVQALGGVDFNLLPGEIHCLVGENGAGKSTFIKVVTGVHSPDGGEIILDGEQLTLRNPLDAQRMGIAAIYQHVTSYPDLTVAENIFMGHEKTTRWIRRIDWPAMHLEAQALLDQLDANFSSRERMSNLSAARRQIVEIAKALSADARIIIMDEPTAALTQHESDELYRITRGLRESGVSVIFISHRMEDIRQLADRVTVFRDGQYIGTWPGSEIDLRRLIVAMVGREVSQMYPKRRIAIGEELLRVEKLGRIGFFQDVSFNLHRGEVLAITGLVGAGRTEVCETLYGVRRWDSGRVFLENREIAPGGPIEALDLGIGFLPEDRQLQGLVMEWEIGKNITLPALSAYARLGWLNEEKENRAAGALGKRLAVKAKTIFTRVSALSGGNQQKVVVAKILNRDLKIVILDEPTKGVDVAAKAAICGIIGDLAEQGYGIILISSEMPEVLGMSDRIVVMREGRVTARLDTACTSQEEILNAAMVAERTAPGAQTAGGRPARGEAGRR